MGEDKLHEECAVFGISTSTDEAAGITYNGLLAMQHRGQEGAGIAVYSDHKIYLHKDEGLVSEVFPGDGLQQLPKGKTAVGHNRYSTTGSNCRENVGPFMTEYLTGRIVTAHNGNVTNASELRKQLEDHGVSFNSTNDSEVVSSLIAYCMVNNKDVLLGIADAANQMRGAFSLIIMTGENQLIAVRDPNGYRPLCIGQNEHGLAIASESCALDSCGFQFLRDVQPGELVLIENGKILRQQIMLTQKNEHGGLCIFEYVYFARTDSIIDGLGVYQARRNMGAVLAEEYPTDADVVCGVPDSGLEAAIGYSLKSGIPLVPGFVKNRYIGRSFIYPVQSQRETAVRMKLNPLSATISGKRIVLVDDSIVRGTTSSKIVSSLKHAGAKEVHMRVSSPPFRHACNFGTDIDSEENLIANKMSLEAVCRTIGADSLGFISIGGLKRTCAESARQFCTYCFDGLGKQREYSEG